MTSRTPALGLSLTAFALAALVAAPVAPARRVVRLRIELEGQVEADYGTDPADDINGRYTAAWSWTRSVKVTYGRSGPRLARNESIRLDETSSLIERDLSRPGHPVRDISRCGSAGGHQREHEHHAGSGAISAPRGRYSISAGIDVRSLCNGLDHTVPDVGHGSATRICVFECTLPSNQLSDEAAVSLGVHGGVSDHTAAASYRVTVTYSDSAAPRRVRNRLPDDF